MGDLPLMESSLNMPTNSELAEGLKEHHSSHFKPSSPELKKKSPQLRNMVMCESLELKSPNLTNSTYSRIKSPIREISQEDETAKILSGVLKTTSAYRLRENSHSKSPKAKSPKKFMEDEILNS